MMNNRESLITRKQEVLHDLTTARRRLHAIDQSAGRQSHQERKQLERQIEQLMAEEYRLRIAIDQAKQQ